MTPSIVTAGARLLFTLKGSVDAQALIFSPWFVRVEVARTRNSTPGKASNRLSPSASMATRPSSVYTKSWMTKRPGR